MNKFWPLSENKVSFQQIFIKWAKECQKNDSSTILLGGLHEEDDNMRVQIESGFSTVERLLQCSHKEADDWAMFHLNHVVKVAKYHSVTVASPDTDVFVCTINHFKQLMFFDLNEFWFISDRSHSTTAVPIHDLVDHVNADVFDILPPVHALTGCDTISKIDAKTAAVNTANKCSYELICSFGKTGITDEIIGNAEKFLLKYISNQNLNEFDDTRYRLYYKKLHQFHLEKFIPVSSGIRQHTYCRPIYNVIFDFMLRLQKTFLGTLLIMDVCLMT